MVRIRPEPDHRLVALGRFLRLRRRIPGRSTLRVASGIGQFGGMVRRVAGAS